MNRKANGISNKILEGMKVTEMGERKIEKEQTHETKKEIDRSVRRRFKGCKNLWEIKIGKRLRKNINWRKKERDNWESDASNAYVHDARGQKPDNPTQ